MLELARPAFAEMAARRRGVVRTVFKRAIRLQHVARRSTGNVLAARSNAVAFGSDADDRFS